MMVGKCGCPQAPNDPRQNPARMEIGSGTSGGRPVGKQAMLPGSIKSPMPDSKAIVFDCMCRYLCHVRRVYLCVRAHPSNKNVYVGQMKTNQMRWSFFYCNKYETP
jgi:hypothetical protein